MERKLRVSPSSLGLLEDCRRCFWLKVVKGVSRPCGPFPSLPSGMDKLLKRHFDFFRKNGGLPPELAGVDAVLFDDEKLLGQWMNNFKGIRFEEDGVLFTGAVDCLLEKDGKLIVLDFKTKGFAVKDGDEHYYQDQLDCYNYLLRKNHHSTQDYAYLLYYVPEKINEKGEFLFQTKLVKMQVNAQHAEQLFRKAVEIIKGEMPEASEECGYCGWTTRAMVAQLRSELS